MSVGEVTVLCTMIAILIGMLSYNITKNRVKIIEIDHLKVGDQAWILYKFKATKVFVESWTLRDGCNGFSSDYNVRLPQHEAGCIGIDINGDKVFRSENELLLSIRSKG